MFKIRLKELRESKGMTQRDFAAEFGVSKGTVGMWESGAREPRTIDEINRIADYFGVSTDYLLGRAEKKEKPAPTDGDGPTLDASLVERLIQLTPEEREKVEVFVQGMIAGRDAHGSR